MALLITGGGAASAAPAYRAYVFTFNMCGGDRGSDACPEQRGSGIVEEITAKVEKYQPVAFALQEACNWQVAQVVARLQASPALKARGLRYVAEFRNAGKEEWPVPPKCYGRWVPEAGRFVSGGWGNAVVHVGPEATSGARTLFQGTYATQAPWIRRAQDRGYLCSLVLPYRLWVCSTHLETTDAGVRRAQTAELARVTGTIRSRHVPAYPMVVGGDFNAEPGEASIGVMLNAGYRNGTGTFSEGALRADRTYDAGTESTYQGKKIDYLFASLGVTVLDTYPLDAKSDHRMLVNRIAFG